MSNSANSGFTSRIVNGCAVVLVLLTASGCATDAGRQGGALEHQLMAEIAFQRGEYYASAREYLELARETGDPDHARRATELAYEFGYDVYALHGAELWADIEPENALADAYLGRMYLRRNQGAKAFIHLERGMGPQAERDDRDYVGLAAELGADVPPVRALTVFEQFSEAEPERAGVWAGIATLAGATGDFERAVSASRTTIRLAPDWMIARIWLARFLLSAGDQSSAFEQMAFALEMNPGLEMELEFVQLLAMAGAVGDARDRLARLDDRYPANPDVLRTRALLAIEWEDYEGARADFRGLLSEAWFVNESFWYLGEIAYRQENYLQALRYFERVAGGIWFVPARNAISQGYLALGDGATALAVQRELAADYPKQHVSTLRPQAEILGTMDRFDEAIAIADEVIEYKPWDERNWIFRGGLLEQAGRPDAAIKSFREAVKLAPDSALGLNALGYTLANTGQSYREAEKLIRRALELAPGNAAYMDSLGWVRYRKGDLEEALRWLGEAYALQPDPEIGAHLGEVLWEMGQQDEAVDIWAGALTLFPEDEALNETTGRYLQ